MVVSLPAQSQPESRADADLESGWDALVADFVEEHLEARPPLAVQAGRHEFDGRLPDWSREGLRAEVRRLERTRERVEDFDPDRLSPDSRFEREHLLAEIDRSLFWRDTARRPLENPLFYADALDPAVYVSREYAPLRERMRAFTGYARAVPEAAAQIRDNLESPLPRTYLDFGRRLIGGLAAYYEEDVPAAFESVEDPDLRSSFSEANAGAVTAMRELDAWLEDELASATGEFALGEERFRQMLWATERVDVPLEELERAASEDLERNLAGLHRACEEMAPGDDVRTCIRRTKSHKPRQGVAEAAREQVARMKEFVRAEDLVTIPEDGEVRIAESPRYLRWNPAFIEIPGPYERGLPATFYLSPPDASWTEEERHDYLPSRTDLLFISAHEVWPGHFLQFLNAHRSPSSVARLFVGYGFAEGWAHYAEELCREAGFHADDPEMALSFHHNALFRNVRMLCSIGLHTGRMTVEEAESAFREKAFQDPANARQQAARGTFEPEYLAYTMGKLMVRKLRDDWTTSREGRASWREFHDRLLSFGSPPLPLIREAMLGVGSGSLF